MQGRRNYRDVRYGVEKMRSNDLPRHCHRAGYANVVLDGAFIEAGFGGWHQVGPGDVLVHRAFDCHANRAQSRRPMRMLRLPWFGDPREGVFRIDDPDHLVRVCESSPAEAMLVLHRALRVMPDREPEWPERLARTLACDPRLRIGPWSEANGLTPEAVARGFRRRYGISPAAFRLEAMTRAAWRDAITRPGPLTAIAFDHGFADLAHMSRSICALTGWPPSRWRSTLFADQFRSSWPATVAG